MNQSDDFLVLDKIPAHLSAKAGREAKAPDPPQLDTICSDMEYIWAMGLGGFIAPYAANDTALLSAFRVVQHPRTPSTVWACGHRLQEQDLRDGASESLKKIPALGVKAGRSKAFLTRQLRDLPEHEYLTGVGCDLRGYSSCIPRRRSSTSEITPSPSTVPHGPDWRGI